MLLAIDLGNTRLKGAFFKDREPSNFFSISSRFIEEKNLLPWLKNFHLDGVIIASVVPAFNIFLEKFFKKFYQIDPIFVNYTHVPIKIITSKPGTIGADLLAGLVGASIFYPHQNLIVIDLGTIITFSVLNVAQEFLGVVFYPGVSTVMQSMHNFTAQLPIIKVKPVNLSWGIDTESAMQSGLYHGQLGAIKEIVTQIKNNLVGEVKVIVTGGDGAFLKGLYDDYLPNLVFVGLRKIWEFYAK